MKHWHSILLAGLLSSSVLAESTTPADTSALEQEAQQVVQQFGGQLKSVLQASMMSGGPVQAMQVCKTNAPQIAQTVGAEQGWIVARTSIKVRNPNNQPDAWEAQVLADWADKIANGAPVAGLKTSAVVEQNGKPVFRYMQAIPTADLCLNCHGSQLSAQVQETLQALYPQDQATGFAAGDLRGAFSLQKSL